MKQIWPNLGYLEYNSNISAILQVTVEALHSRVGYLQVTRRLS